MKVLRTSLLCFLLLFAFVHLNLRTTPVRLQRPNQWTQILLDVPPKQGWPFTYSSDISLRYKVALNQARATASYYLEATKSVRRTTIQWQTRANALCAITLTVFACFTNYFVLERWMPQRSATLRDLFCVTALLALVCAAYFPKAGNTFRSEPNLWDNLAQLSIYLAVLASVACWGIFLGKNLTSVRTTR
ncbi:MAG: hypothetical protein ACE361_20260 [Aureliella sp.]